MNDRQITDREIRHAFIARADGSPSPDLAERIRRTALHTRQQRRRALIPGGLLGASQRLVWAAVISATSLAVVGGLLLAGRQNDDRTRVALSPLPSATLEPSPNASATPSASPSPTQSAAPTNQTPTIAIDSFAAITGADYVPVSTEPGGEPVPFHGSLGGFFSFMAGFPLVVVSGPVIVDGVEWYYFVHAERVSDTMPGWAPIDGPSGTRWIEPTTVTCLPSPMTTEQMSQEGARLTNGLPVCYGDTEITITGELVCGALDPLIRGTSWLDVGWGCRLDAQPEGIAVYSVAADFAALTNGRYRVTGHFDDAESDSCHWPAFGEGSDMSPLLAILECRKSFIATRFEPA